VVVYFPAVSQQEAEECVDAGYGWDTREEAEEHLKRIQAPPTDYEYARQYKIWEVLRTASGKRAECLGAPERDWMGNVIPFEKKP